MSKRIFFAAMASMASVPPGHAESTITASSVEDCQADIEVVLTAFLPPMPADLDITDADMAKLYADAPVEYRDGRCVLDQFSTRSLYMPPGMERSFVIGPVNWQAEWSGAGRVFPPSALSLRVEGFRQKFSAGPEMAEFAYMQNVIIGQQNGALQLEFRSDPQARSLELTRLEITPNGTDRLVLSAKLTDINLPDIAGGPRVSISDLLRIGVTDIELSLTNRGFFQSMVGMWLQAVYPRMGETPEQAVEAAQTKARDFIATIPATLATDDSRAALTALIDSLPQPSGDLHLALHAPDGLTAGKIAPATVVSGPSWQLLEEPLRDVRIEAEWTPAPAP